MAKAFNTHPDATVMVTFASLRSVYDTVMEALDYPQLRVIAVIAEGVPENQTRRILQARAHLLDPNILTVIACRKQMRKALSLLDRQLWAASSPHVSKLAILEA